MSTMAQVAPRAENPSGWLTKGLVIAGLIGFLYAPVLKRLIAQWWQDPSYGHGFVVPLLAAYVLFRRRDIHRKIAIDPSNLGLLVMGGAISLLITGTLGAELFVSRFSLLVLLCGIVLFLAGWKMLRAVAFPLSYLLLMIPLPAIIFNELTFPLQLLASRLSASCLELVGVPVLREGNVLILPNYALEVVEACSGIRSLTALVALAIAYCYFTESRLWIRIAIVALMLPIAVVSNAMRVVGTGLLTYVFGSNSAEGFFHFFQGWLIFVAAVLLMLLAHWMLNQLATPGREASV